MPFYEYDCLACGETFEKLLRFSESDQLPVCPKCASAETQKKLSEVVALGTDTASSTSSVNSSCDSQEGFS